MKIRKGFVSNSSTTSFCIYGLYFDSNAAAVAASSVDSMDEIDYALLHYGQNDEVYAGLSPTEIEDDETGRQFKDRIEEKLKEIFPNLSEHQKFGYFEDAYYDG